MVARGWGFEVIAAEAIGVTVLGNWSAGEERRWLSRHLRGELRRRGESISRSSSLLFASAVEYIVVVGDCNCWNCLWRSGTISSP